jgi:hypothetical protein
MIDAEHFFSDRDETPSQRRNRAYGAQCAARPLSGGPPEVDRREGPRTFPSRARSTAQPDGPQPDPWPSAGGEP